MHLYGGFVKMISSQMKRKWEHNEMRRQIIFVNIHLFIHFDKSTALIMFCFVSPFVYVDWFFFYYYSSICVKHCGAENRTQNLTWFVVYSIAKLCFVCVYKYVGPCAVYARWRLSIYIHPNEILLSKFTINNQRKLRQTLVLILLALFRYFLMFTHEQ